MNSSLFSGYSDIETNFNECSEPEQINKIIEYIYKLIEIGTFFVRANDNDHNKKEYIEFHVAECRLSNRIIVGKLYNDLYNYEVMMTFLSFSNAKLNIVTLMEAIRKTFNNMIQLK